MAYFKSLQDAVKAQPAEYFDGFERSYSEQGKSFYYLPGHKIKEFYLAISWLDKALDECKSNKALNAIKVYAKEVSQANTQELSENHECCDFADDLKAAERDIKNAILDKERELGVQYSSRSWCHLYRLPSEISISKSAGMVFSGMYRK
jgi:hypothetical protein